jgi:nucleoside-diphosphate-sugar epimerase
MRTVLLSGASGFIAQKTAEKLKKSGFRTVGISHSSPNLPHFDAVYEGTLSQSFKGAFRESIDAFIHCAYHSGGDDYAVNVEGTRLWADQAEKEGVKEQIFLSSVSARSDSPSTYSRAKYALEHWFVGHGYTVLRMGLVVGSGGLFLRMANLVKKSPVLPIIDGGRPRVYVSGIQDVCKALLLAVEPGSWVSGKAWNLFQSEPFYLREILEEIKKYYRIKRLFFPVPSKLALGMVRILENIPWMKLGISSNNIIGLKQNVSLEWESDYGKFGYPEMSLEQLIAQAF